MSTATKYDPYTPPTERVSRTIRYEVYFDLWGLSIGWIEAIQNALHDYADTATDDVDSYTCPANVSCRFVSTDPKRTKEAERIFNRLINLAKKTEKRRAYGLLCG